MRRGPSRGLLHVKVNFGGTDLTKVNFAGRVERSHRRPGRRSGLSLARIYQIRDGRR
jgi:hypothetical protein